VLILAALLVGSAVLVLALKGASMLMAERAVLSREEQSPYECGFEHHNSSRIPLSLRYFYVTLLFLLFDLEIVFLIFLPQLISASNMFSVLETAIYFVLFLYLSLMYE